MGQVIRRSASADDIFADVRKTLENAAAKGEPWNSAAQEHLASVATLVATVEQRLGEAKSAAATLMAKLAAEDDRADDLLGKVADDIWNAVGRPAADPALAILFPGGIAYYAEGSTEDQPLRMELLAELLEAGIHPRLPEASARAAAAEIRAGAARLRAAEEEARGPRLRLWLYQRIRTAVARAAQIQLTNLKRAYKAAGRSEAEIHAVIPDHPEAPPAKPAPQPTPP